MEYHQEMGISVIDWGLKGDNAEALAATLNRYVQRLRKAPPNELKSAGEAVVKKFSTMLACSSCQEAGIGSPLALGLLHKTLKESGCTSEDIALWESKWIKE